MLTRREREKLQRKKDIFEAAKMKFFEKPYDRVSMDSIAREVELSKTTLYLYFKNKQSLYFSIILEGMETMLDMFTQAIKEKTSGINKIESIIFAFNNYAEKYSKFYILNRSVRSERFSKMLSEGQIENAESYIELTKKLFNILFEAVSLGIKDGSLRKDLDPIQTTILISSTIEATVDISFENQILLHQFKIPHEKYLQHSIGIILYGICGSKKSEKQ